MAMLAAAALASAPAIGAETAASPQSTAVADERAYLRYKEELDALIQSGSAAPKRATTDQSGNGSQSESTTCQLFQPAGDRVGSDQCMACHGAAAPSGSAAILRDSHPVDIDYVSAQARAGASSLRRADDVVTRGVFLPGGMIRCGTCHDAHSQWKYHLALPPRSTPEPAADPHDTATYEQPHRASLVPLPPGTSVSPTPLCLVCHAF
jgi:hypothetical protein